MADLGFFESLALGMIAGDTVTRDWPRLAAEASAARRLRNEAAAQDQVIDALIAENEHLRAIFNALVAAAEQVQREANTAAQEYAQLRQELAAANERARQADAREAETKQTLGLAEKEVKVLRRTSDERLSDMERLEHEIILLKRR
jgi:chromosome segregation ATPase